MDVTQEQHLKKAAIYFHSTRTESTISIKIKFLIHKKRKTSN